MINKLLLFGILSIVICSCSSRVPEKSDSIISMQLIDRNGFTETISNKERIKTFEATNFLQPQPFQKVLRIFNRNSSGQSYSKITSYHENGQLWQYLEAIDGRAHGLYKEWFLNGSQKVEAHLIEGVADIHDIAQATWVFHGPCKVWDEAGSLTAEFYYEKGLLDTPARYFFKNGTLEKIIPYHLGEVHGPLQRFDTDGTLLEQTPYYEGNREGQAVSYWNSNQLLSNEIFSKDLLSEASYFDPLGNCVAQVIQGNGKQAVFKEGHLHTLYTIEKGVIEGPVQIFNPDGTLHCTYNLKEGKKQGEEWEYYPSKKGEDLKPKISVHWNEDTLQGQVKTWYPNGNRESQREINQNKKRGVALSWYKNGDLMLIEEYENDLLIKGSYYKLGDKKPVSKIESGKGLATLFTSDGFYLKKISYEKGKPLPNEKSSLELR